MSITSKTLGIAAAAGLAGCILQGPWNFTPDNKPAFRGIWASAYAVADRPAGNVCFERLLGLNEAFTLGAPFYDSAAVGITGRFSSGGQTLLLQPRFDIPNCFSGDTAARFVRGENYTLSARFVWDSSGTRVTSLLTAEAGIPQSFSVADTAVAPSVALTGLAFDANFFTLANLQKLPPGPRAQIIQEYGDTLSKLSQDSVALKAYLDKNGPTIFNRLVSLLQNDQVKYVESDTMFYIGGNSSFNNLSHHFHSIRSSDVAGVLITQRWDTASASRPVTTFDSIAIKFGIKVDTGDYYYPGDRHRLVMLPNTVNQKGYSVLDSMGVVNAWFWTGRNRLYFYGVEKAYNDYQFTNTQVPGGGPVDQNPKITPSTNVAGGRGFFAGMVVDSFDVLIKVDSVTDSYPYTATRAFACRKQGWFETRDCSGWYREFCRDNHWVREDCRLDMLYSALDSADSLILTPALRDSARTIATRDAILALEATRRYCTDHNYPANVAGCAPVQQECETGSTGNACQLLLWKSCELDYWNMPACAEGRKSLCGAKGDIYTDLCRGINP